MSFTKRRFNIGDLIQSTNNKAIGKITGFTDDGHINGSYKITWLKYGELRTHRDTIQHIAYTDIHYRRLKNGRLLYGER